MDRFEVLSLGSGPSNANNGGNAVDRNSLLILAPNHCPTGNLDLIIFYRNGLRFWSVC
jgi:hypothetical protein